MVKLGGILNFDIKYQRLFNTKHRAEQSETTALSFKADPKGEITNRVKQGEVALKKNDLLCSRFSSCLSND